MTVFSTMKLAIAVLCFILIPGCANQVREQEPDSKSDLDLRGFHAEPAEPIGVFFKVGAPASRAESLPASISTLQGDAATNLSSDLEIWKKVDERFGFTVSGHTDNEECAGKDCDDLSLRRATIVREWLISNGVASRRIKPAIGYGDRRPIESNDTEEGRARNRHVSIDVFVIVQ